MKVLVIADDGPANLWLLRALEEQVAVCGIVRPDWAAPKPPQSVASAPQRTQRPSVGTRLMRRLRQGWYAMRDKAAHAALESALFPAGESPSIRSAQHTVPAWDINGERTRHIIENAAPDLILVSGAPILKQSIYAIPPRGTVNLHFGISPAYRGMHTMLRPWQQRDYANIGATLHSVDAGIDTGPVLARLYPAITPDDTIVSIEAAIVRLAASTVLEFLTWRAAQGPNAIVAGQRVAEPGTLVRYHDRRIRDDLRDRLGRVAGERPPQRAGRVERYFGA